MIALGTKLIGEEDLFKGIDKNKLFKSFSGILNRGITA